MDFGARGLYYNGSCIRTHVSFCENRVSATRAITRSLHHIVRSVHISRSLSPSAPTLLSFGRVANAAALDGKGRLTLREARRVVNLADARVAAALS